MLRPAGLIAASLLLALTTCKRREPAAIEPAARSSVVVRLADGILAMPYTGRVYVQIAPLTEHAPEPRLAERWMRPPMILARDVESWNGGPLPLHERALAFPGPIDDLEPGGYHAQAFIRLNPLSPEPGRGDGDAISPPLAFERGVEGGIQLELMIDRTVKVENPQDSERTRWIEIRSELLSDFHGFDHPLQAGVRLPADWDPARSQRHPVLVYVGGFDEDHIHTMRSFEASDGLFDSVVVITPNARNRRGHSVFVDSDSIGPWGTALMTELLPDIEGRFQLAGSEKRYLAGLSSGGWAGLWLQIRWPDSFQHVWSFAPDPVDFTDFQGIDLYRDGENFFIRRDGSRRPVARLGEQRIWYEDFVRHEEVLGPGMQIHSFEATFAPRGPNGGPLSLFDRESGEIDPRVAEAFRRFDIQAQLRQHWAELAPKLSGKITVRAGGNDSFYLEGAVRNLRRTMIELGADADIEVVEGLGHSIHPPTWMEMVERLREAADAGPR